MEHWLWARLSTGDANNCSIFVMHFPINSFPSLCSLLTSSRRRRGATPIESLQTPARPPQHSPPTTHQPASTYSLMAGLIVDRQRSQHSLGMAHHLPSTYPTIIGLAITRQPSQHWRTMNHHLRSTYPPITGLTIARQPSQHWRTMNHHLRSTYPTITGLTIARQPSQHWRTMTHHLRSTRRCITGYHKTPDDLPGDRPSDARPRARLQSAASFRRHRIQQL